MVVLLATPRRSAASAALEQVLRSRPSFSTVDVATFDEIGARPHAARPGLAVLLLAPDALARSLAVIRGLRDAGAERVLVVGPATDPKLILQTMQAGGDFFLDQDDLETSLECALARFHHTGPARGLGELIAVLSAAGGCGASTLAANLAVQLARAHGRCNLLDLHTTQADLAALLDLKPQYTLTDLCRREERLDRALYEQLLTVHETGVALLAGPRGYDEVRAVTPGGVEQAVALARESFAHVVADLEDGFHDEQLAVLSQASRVLVVCRLDFLAVRNARRIFDYLVGRGAPREQIEFVVNQAGRTGELPLADAEAALGAKLVYRAPDAPGPMIAAVNAGVPVAVSEPESAYAQSVARIVGLETRAPAGPDLYVRLRAWSRERVLPRLRALGARLRRAPAPPSGAPEAKDPYDVAPSPPSTVVIPGGAPLPRAGAV